MFSYVPTGPCARCMSLVPWCCFSSCLFGGLLIPHLLLLVVVLSGLPLYLCLSLSPSVSPSLAYLSPGSQQVATSPTSITSAMGSSTPPTSSRSSMTPGSFTESDRGVMVVGGGNGRRPPTIPNSATTNATRGEGWTRSDDTVVVQGGPSAIMNLISAVADVTAQKGMLDLG